LLQQDGGLVPRLLGRLEVPVQELTNQVESELDKIRSVASVGGGGAEIYLSRRLSKVLDARVGGGKLVFEPLARPATDDAIDEAVDEVVNA